MVVSKRSDFLRYRLLRIGVVVESAPGLAAVPTREDHPLQQRRGSKALFLKFVEHDLRDVVGGVEAHKVQQRERTHGMAATKLHGIIDVLNRTDALFKGPDRVEKIRHEQAVHDEAGG